MSGIRERFEDRFVRKASRLAQELGGERGAELADALRELDVRTAEVAAAEARLEELEQRLDALGIADATDEALDRAVADFEVREADLSALCVSLAEEQARLSLTAAVLAEREERCESRARELDALASRLADREREVARHESTKTPPAHAEWQQFGRREARLGSLEDAARMELRGLEQREAAFEALAAQLELELELRAGTLDRRAAELEEHEHRLGEKERDLAAYVSAVQTSFANR